MSKVAELAGISQSTVSRVVNEHPGISEETARRVRKAMQDVGYRHRPRGRPGRQRLLRVEGAESETPLASVVPLSSHSVVESLLAPAGAKAAPVANLMLGLVESANPETTRDGSQIPNTAVHVANGSLAVPGTGMLGRLVGISLIIAVCSAAGAAGFLFAPATRNAPPPVVDDRSVAVTATPSGVGSAEGFNAKFIAGADCEWSGVNAPIVQGKELPQGPIQLVRGVAQLKFPNGAEALVEGPASFDLATGSGFFLWSGKLIATAEKGDLMVNTVAAVIGVGGGIETECAIVGEDSGWSEVHVLRGRVDVHPRKNNPEDRLVRRLQTSAAERYETFSRPGWKVIPLEVDRFVRSLRDYDRPKAASYHSVVTNDRPLAYWRLSERSDARVADSSGHEIGGAYKGMVALGQPAAMSRDTDPSVFFQGGWVVVDDMPELQFERDDAFALEAWVRSSIKDIDMRPIGKIGIPGAGFCSGYSMFIRSNVLTFQATHRWHSAKHNVGILDGDVLDVPGTTIVTDGRWHHLVITYDGSSRASGVRLYVDGRSEPINHEDPYFSDTLTGTIRQGVKNLELARGGFAFATNSFMGAMDDVAIYDHVLTPEQVSRHFISAHGSSTPAVANSANRAPGVDVSTVKNMPDDETVPSETNGGKAIVVLPADPIVNP